MARIVLALAVAAVAASSDVAVAARPVPGASYLAWHHSYLRPPLGGAFDREDLFNVSATGRTLSYSAVAMAPGSEFGGPPYETQFASQVRVDSQCANGYESYTDYIINGVRIAADGSFSATLRDVGVNVFSGSDTPHAVFRLRARFDTPATVSGWFSEMRYRRHGKGPWRLYCHSGRRGTQYRVHFFAGRLRPIQWIADHTCIACI